MKITKYVWVSQGIKIGETFDKEEAYAYRDHANEDWEEYKQDCLDNHEPYADNEIFVYEEEVEATQVKHDDGSAEWIWNESCECWECSVCRWSALNDYKGESTRSNFCPTCGSLMKNRYTMDAANSAIEEEINNDVES